MSKWFYQNINKKTPKFIHENKLFFLKGLQYITKCDIIYI